MNRKTGGQRPPFPGLRLRKKDRQTIAKLKRKPQADRVWRRIRTLELLHRGKSLAETGEAVGSYPREIRRVGWRYLEQGLEAALSEDARPKPETMLDVRQQGAIVAMVCGPPPEGSARWSIRLAAKEPMRKGQRPNPNIQTVEIQNGQMEHSSQPSAPHHQVAVHHG